MKYINHMTTSSEDDRHAEMMERAGGNEKGLAAYGLYWVIAERIAAQIRPEQITTWMTRSWKKWGEMCGIRPTLFQKRVKSMAEVGLIFLYCDEKSACIHLPNLLKYADEYTKTVLKKSGQTPESVGRISSPPALPAYPDKKDLKILSTGAVDNSRLGDGASAGGDGLGATPPAAPSPEGSLFADPDVIALGKAIAEKQRLLGIAHPDPPPPPPSNGAGKEENKTTVPQIIQALNLTPEKSEAVAPLFHRHQERPFPNDELASQLLGAGLDANEVFRAAQVFFRKQ
jgi:hypothetical protein